MSSINQIGEHNTKGILVTSSYFQEGTVSFAISKKIGLVRINDKKEIDWVNYRKDKKKKPFQLSATKKFLCEDKMKDINFIALHDKKNFITFPDLLLDIGIIDKYSNKSKFVVIPFKTEKEIFDIINNLPKEKFYKNDRLETKDACSILSSIYQVTFKLESKLDFQNGILGKIKFNPLEIHIAKDLKFDIYRWRFTLAHEIGHLVLHYNILVDYLDDYLDDEHSISYDQSFSIYFNKRLEIQANMFASILLLPREPLLRIVYDYFKQERILNKGYLYFDEQPCNIDLTYRLLREIQSFFLVSKEAAKYRLISLGLLKDATDNSIRGILERTK